jgi:small subunit ribosomal protein S1
VKQLWDDPWPTIFTELPPGKLVRCKVVSVVDYGAFVHIRDGVEGHIPQNEIVVAKDESGEDGTLHSGDEIEAEVANIDSQERRITLTMRTGEAAAPTATGPGEPKPVQRASKTPKKSAAAEAAGGTIGELIKQKLGSKLAAIGDKKDEESGDEE